MAPSPESRLVRRLGTGDAVAVGLAAMIGTGVFVAWQPAASAAGAWLLAGLAVAAFVAFCNAASTAQLAAVHPEAGGAYHYGRLRLGDAWGALAGYAFVLGKSASCATAALAVGAYLWPSQDVLVALAAVAAVTAVNLAGVTRTARVGAVLVALVVVVLAAVVVTGLGDAGVAPDWSSGPSGGVTGVLGSAAVLFYAFAGYARITTLGEEVRDPAAIPRAVVVSLTATLVLYAAVGLTVLLVLGADGTAESARPLRAVAAAAGASWLEPVVAAGAAVAALGALLSLQAGVGRTAFAMASAGDLPARLAGRPPPPSRPARRRTGLRRRDGVVRAGRRSRDDARGERVRGAGVLRGRQRGGVAARAGRAPVAALAVRRRPGVVRAAGGVAAVADGRGGRRRAGRRHGRPRDPAATRRAVTRGCRNVRTAGTRKAQNPETGMSATPHTVSPSSPQPSPRGGASPRRSIDRTRPPSRATPRPAVTYQKPTPRSAIRAGSASTASTTPASHVERSESG